MIRVVMFDLGLTLLDANAQPFPHVREALAAIAGFEADDGKPLRSCLVSDVAMPAPPVTPAKVRAAFDDYLRVLDDSGLRPLFEPVQRRVTLSVQAGATKPARAVFETALRRLRVRAALDECLFITENGAHAEAVRQWGMAALWFRAAGESAFDFDDWSQAPALIAQRVAPDRDANAHAAIRAHLAARGVEVATIAPAGADGARAVSGRVWQTLPGAQGEPLHVPVPVSASVHAGPDGALRSRVATPTPEAIAEAANFAHSLAAHGQIAEGEAVDGDATHAIDVDAQGRRKLVRRRFKAF